MSRSVWPSLSLLLILSLCGRVAADRIVLAPGGLILNPGSARTEYAWEASDSRNTISWFNLGPISPSLPVELEAERISIGGRTRGTFSAQYSFTGNALLDIAPTLSVGMRDVLNQGRERQALFLAVTKSFGLSQGQESYIREIKAHAGYGTSRLAGPFVGLEGRFTLGFNASAEYVARRFNFEIGVPVARVFRMRAYTLNGDVFYGASLTIRR